MKILLCRIPAYFGIKKEHPENCMVPMEFAHLSAIAKGLGVHVTLLDLEATDPTIEELEKEISKPYDYIVLRAKTPSYGIVKQVFPKAKGKIIGTGHLFTTKPEAIFNLPDVPLICTISGEADTSFEQLLIKLKNNEDFSEVPNITYKNDSGEIISNKNQLRQNLDELPSPDYALFDSPNYHTFYPVPFGTRKNYGFMMTSRGCPYGCSFCSPTLRNSFGTGMRYHSKERVTNDLLKLEELGKSIVFFRDDIFTINRSRTIELCNEMIKKKVKIKWCTQTHLNHIDEELLDIMQKAGCVSLGCGLESGSQKILDVVNKTNKIANAPRLVNYAKSIGIKMVCFFLVGCPGENEEDHQLSLELLKNTMPNLIQVAFFTPYPGSRDYEEFIVNKSNYNSSLHHYNNYEMNLTTLSKEEIDAFQKTLYKTWLFTPRTLFFILTSLISDLFLNFSFFKNFLKKGVTFFLRILSQKRRTIKADHI